MDGWRLRERRDRSAQPFIFSTYVRIISHVLRLLYIADDGKNVDSTVVFRTLSYYLSLSVLHYD